MAVDKFSCSKNCNFLFTIYWPFHFINVFVLLWSFWVVVLAIWPFFMHTTRSARKIALVQPFIGFPELWKTVGFALLVWTLKKFIFCYMFYIITLSPPHYRLFTFPEMFCIGCCLDVRSILPVTSADVDEQHCMYFS